MSVLYKTVGSKSYSLSFQTCKTYNSHVIKLSRKFRKKKKRFPFILVPTNLLTSSKSGNLTLLYTLFSLRHCLFINCYNEFFLGFSGLPNFHLNYLDLFIFVFLGHLLLLLFHYFITPFFALTFLDCSK